MKISKSIRNIFAIGLLILAIFLTSTLKAFADKGSNDVVIDLSSIEDERFDGSDRIFKVWKLSDKTLSTDEATSIRNSLELKDDAYLDKTYGDSFVTDKSDTDETIRIRGDLVGTYYFRETDSGNKSIGVSSFILSFPLKSQSHVVFPKDKNYYSLVILTKVNEKGDRLSGAIFNLYEKKRDKLEAVPLSGTFYDKSGDTLSPLTTDSKGELRISGLPEGQYVFREVKAPEGYIISNRDSQVILDSDGDRESIEVVNRKSDKGRISFLKVDGDTDDRLNAARFKLSYKDKLTDKDIFVKDDKGKELVMVSDKDGKFQADNLPFGEYYLREVKAPEGYEKLKDGIKLTVDAKDSTKTFKVNNYRVPGRTPPPKGGNHKGGEFPKTGDILLEISVGVGFLLFILGFGLVRKESKL